MARAARETLVWQSRVASSQVKEGERLLQLLRDDAQVAQLRVEEMNENIGHMMEEFREEAEEVAEVGEAGSTKPGNVWKFESEVEASLSAQGIWDDDASETGGSQDNKSIKDNEVVQTSGSKPSPEGGRSVEDEVIQASGGILLTESALKELNNVP
jgi:hypothetical protein